MGDLRGERAQAASLELDAAAPTRRRASAALIGWPKM
jgi:hypothetical protein